VSPDLLEAGLAIDADLDTVIKAHTENADAEGHSPAFAAIVAQSPLDEDERSLILAVRERGIMAVSTERRISTKRARELHSVALAKMAHPCQLNWLNL
jgi:hypothetical protein